MQQSKMQSFDCPYCGVVSMRDFGDFNPHCRNGECPDKWWNKNRGDHYDVLFAIIGRTGKAG